MPAKRRKELRPRTAIRLAATCETFILFLLTEKTRITDPETLRLLAGKPEFFINTDGMMNVTPSQAWPTKSRHAVRFKVKQPHHLSQKLHKKLSYNNICDKVVQSKS